ncbi:MAG: hypothetical protein CM15mP14_1630 [Rhodospirillaceae bacterium]|nr:MAG: hypothetical protein CM15mP14_1630 [Rhodospirillaceae bacterium]
MPPEFHKKYALQAIDASMPLYLEKPLGVDVQESESLVELLEQRTTLMQLILFKPQVSDRESSRTSE